MAAKIVMIVAFIAVAVGVGVYSRRRAQGVEGFVLGGRSASTV